MYNDELIWKKYNTHKYYDILNVLETSIGNKLHMIILLYSKKKNTTIENVLDGKF